MSSKKRSRKNQPNRPVAARGWEHLHDLYGRPGENRSSAFFDLKIWGNPLIQVIWVELQCTSMALGDNRSGTPYVPSFDWSLMSKREEVRGSNQYDCIACIIIIQRKTIIIWSWAGSILRTMVIPSMNRDISIPIKLLQIYPVYIYIYIYNEFPRLGLYPRCLSHMHVCIWHE